MSRLVIFLIALPSLILGQNGSTTNVDFFNLVDDFKSDNVFWGYMVDTLAVSTSSLRALMDDLTVLSYSDSNITGVVKKKELKKYDIFIQSKVAKTSAVISEKYRDGFKIYYYGRGGIDHNILPSGVGEILIKASYVRLPERACSGCVRVVLTYWVKSSKVLINVFSGIVKGQLDKQFRRALRHIEETGSN